MGRPAAITPPSAAPARESRRAAEARAAARVREGRRRGDGTGASPREDQVQDRSPDHADEQGTEAADPVAEEEHDGHVPRKSPRSACLTRSCGRSQCVYGDDGVEGGRGCRNKRRRNLCQAFIQRPDRSPRTAPRIADAATITCWCGCATRHSTQVAVGKSHRGASADPRSRRRPRGPRASREVPTAQVFGPSAGGQTYLAAVVAAGVTSTGSCAIDDKEWS
ncbi:hypothetical protein ADL04_01295 [Streptomyces sp. NRRL B-3648]|nr:hypothetical protein ADL04_01295 [Streptomyces sp. NRRL B-3648]